MSSTNQTITAQLPGDRLAPHDVLFGFQLEGSEAAFVRLSLRVFQKVGDERLQGLWRLRSDLESMITQAERII